MSVRLPGAVAVLLLLMLTGCGVPTENTPRPITPFGGVPIVSRPRTSASAVPGTPVELLYLVRDAHLVAVRRPAERVQAIDEQLARLLAGPTAAERRAGLSGALTGITVIGAIRIQNGKATVEIGSRPEGIGRSDEVLAYGQLVCTLAARADVDSVSFVHDGEPLRIPRADASLTEDPLTAADYAVLIAPA